MVLSLESSVSSFPTKSAKVNFKICVYLLLSMNLQLNILQEGEKTEWGHSRTGYLGKYLSMRKSK